MHSDGIWNDLKLQRKKWKQCLWSMLSDGMWNDSELQRKKMKTMSLKHVLWCNLKRFGTAEKNLKTRMVNVHSDSIWNDLEMPRQFWNQTDGKLCIMMVFETAIRKTVHVLT